MRSPAAAFAWAFCRRHRWGLAAVGLYLAVLVVIRLLVLAPGEGLAFEDRWSFALVVVVPLASTFLYFLAVFSFGLAGDLAQCESIYPAGRFTLPVTSAALVGWPMLYGGLAMAALWLATRGLAVWPSGAEVPWVWPALLAAVLLAWTQALTWMPYPLPGLRVLVTVVWLAGIGFAVLLALHLKTRETVMLVLLAPHLPVAFGVAHGAVARARRGDVLDGWGVWARFQGARFPGARVWRVRRAVRRQRGPFSSPARAQLWFEWHRHGRSLPTLVAIPLPFVVSLLFIFRETPVLVYQTLAVGLLTPPFLAGFVAASVRKSGPESRDADQLTPFLATRPLTSAALLAAKLQATVLSTLATWLLVVIALGLGLWLSGAVPIVADGVRPVIEILGAPRAVVLGFLVLAALVLWTWKRLVQSLYLGLSGRPWLVQASGLVTLAGFTCLVPLVPWILRNGRVVIAETWKALPGLVVALAVCKIVAAFWVTVRLYDRRAVSPRTLIQGALGWTVSVFALYGLLVWLLPELLFFRDLLALIAILAIPLVRLSAAPLALSGNRHR